MEMLSWVLWKCCPGFYGNAVLGFMEMLSWEVLCGVFDTCYGIRALRSFLSAAYFPYVLIYAVGAQQLLSHKRQYLHKIIIQCFQLNHPNFVFCSVHGGNDSRRMKL